MITPIEIIDTAVKIGLGAFISGVAAFWIARLNHDREMEKDHARRRRELLEDVAERVQQFSSVSLKYWAFVINLANDERRGKLPVSRYEEVREVRAELFDAFAEFTSAEAKLLLLGEEKSKELLRDFGEAVRSFRADPYEKFTDTELREIRSNILAKREAFFANLSSAYKYKRI